MFSKIASFSLPMQYSVYWYADFAKPEHRLAYGADSRILDSFEDAEKHFYACCHHAKVCAGLEPADEEEDSE